MFSKHVKDLIFSDIDDLVNLRQEREGYFLDYKVGFGNADKSKKELAKDISAFANASGGFLIIGVDKNYNILGVERLFQNKGIDEWINQVLSSNVEPPIFYFDPKIIPIPESDRVLVVIHVPESSMKPHIVTEWNNYHVRINDSSKSANHSQIRDMYELSKRRTDEFNEFVIKKNLFDEESDIFGQNINSSKLLSDIPAKLNKSKPIVIFSLFTKYPNKEKILIPFLELKSWLVNNSKGYDPWPTFSIFNDPYLYDSRHDGVVLKNMNGNEISSYFEILNSGYIEAGFSCSFFGAFSDGFERKLKGAIFLTPLIIYEMMLLSFAKEFYDMVRYFDDVILQLSFANTLDYTTMDLNAKYNRGWRGERPVNTQHNNFKLTHSFNPKTMTDYEILQIAKHHSEKVCRAFGLDQDYCFVDDQLSLNERYNFSL